MTANDLPAKCALRKSLIEKREEMDEAERRQLDAVIQRKVISHPAFIRADAVLTYLSIGCEVDTRSIVEAAWSQGKTVAIPRCTGPHRMEWFRIHDFDGLETSPFGIKEPPLDAETAIHPAACQNPIALVPGLAFDKAGFRLGYGGGFYDAFLQDFKGVSMGLCRAGQQVDSLQSMGMVEPHDQPVDVIVVGAAAASAI